MPKLNFEARLGERNLFGGLPKAKFTCLLDGAQYHQENWIAWPQPVLVASLLGGYILIYGEGCYK
jgi:hypothetical protein